MQVRVRLRTTLSFSQVAIDGVRLPVGTEFEVELDHGTHELSWFGRGEAGERLQITITAGDRVLRDVTSTVATGHAETFGVAAFVVGDARTGPRKPPRIRRPGPR
jgi:hypothetical protein